jgi:dihydropteroate synthase
MSRDAPARILRARDRVLELGGRPWLMGIVNASPDSFSDGDVHATLEDRVRLAERLLAAGADILDVGGESATTGRPPVEVEEEIARVVPLIERLAGDLDATVSVDTYKPAVARAAITAGARIVNDVSGLRDPELADVCASSGAALVIMHTLAAPRVRIQDPDLYEDIAGEVAEFLSDRIELAVQRGVSREQIVLDPGPDFAKTPKQTIAVLSSLRRFGVLGRPLLLAISRKDFIGALVGRAPRERLAGTLAALAHGLDQGAHIFRVHDVAAARDFIVVRAALRGEVDVDAELALADDLRHEAPEPRRGAPQQTLG